MPGRIALIVALAAGLVFPMTTPAVAQEDGEPRVLVLWLDGTTLSDWSAEDLPAFGALLAEGAVGIMTAATTYEGGDPVDAGLAAAETLGAGRIVRGAPTSDRRRTPVALTLATFGITTSLLSGAPEPLPRTAERAFGPLGVIGGGRYARADRSFPGGARTDPDALIRALDGDASRARLVIVQVPDALLAERELPDDPAARTRWAALTMRRADRVLAAMRERAGARDLVMVVSPTPPRARRGDAPPLTAVAVARGNVSAGTLRSATTHRDGLVSLSDVAPTILAGLGVSPAEIELIVLTRFIGAPLPFDGNPMEAVPRADAAGAARALERDLIATVSAHGTSARAFLLGAIAVVLLGALTVVSARGRPATADRIPRGWRDGLATAGIAVAAFPGGSLLAGAFGTSWWLALVIAVAVAVVVRAAMGRERGAASVVLVSAFLVLGDVLAGGTLAVSNALREPLAWGRVLGPIDPVAVGVLLAALPAAGTLMDHARADERWIWSLLAFGGAATFLSGSQGAGGDGGAAAALIPAALMFAATAWGLRRDIFSGTTITAVTIAGLGLLALTYGPAIWVDETPLLPQRGVPTWLGARLDAFVEVLPTMWPAGLIITGGVVLALRMKRPMLTDRGWWGRAHLRAGAFGATVGAAICLVTVRMGPIAAAVAVTLTALVLLMPLLAPDD